MFISDVTVKYGSILHHPLFAGVLINYISCFTSLLEGILTSVHHILISLYPKKVCLIKAPIRTNFFTLKEKKGSILRRVKCVNGLLLVGYVMTNGELPSLESSMHA